MVLGATGWTAELVFELGMASFVEGNVCEVGQMAVHERVLAQWLIKGVQAMCTRETPYGFTAAVLMSSICYLRVGCTYRWRSGGGWRLVFHIPFSHDGLGGCLTLPIEI